MDLAPIHGRLVVVGVNRAEDSILPRVGIRKELNIKFVLGYQREDVSLVLDLMASRRDGVLVARGRDGQFVPTGNAGWLNAPSPG
jgi:hypothetical protein